MVDDDDAKIIRAIDFVIPSGFGNLNPCKDNICLVDGILRSLCYHLCVCIFVYLIAVEIPERGKLGRPCTLALFLFSFKAPMDILAIVWKFETCSA